jgi:flagellar basal-body rod protein FlgC
MDLGSAMAVSASGLKAQATRIRVISENIANAESVATTAGGKPYSRKLIEFQPNQDRTIGAETVKVKRITDSKAPFTKMYDPAHPAADADGYVLRPNVNSFVEMMDMKEAQHSYSANLNAMEASRNMLRETIGLLQ